jgi:hypothetical protein
VVKEALVGRQAEKLVEMLVKEEMMRVVVQLLARVQARVPQVIIQQQVLQLVRQQVLQLVRQLVLQLVRQLVLQLVLQQVLQLAQQLALEQALAQVQLLQQVLDVFNLEEDHQVKEALLVVGVEWMVEAPQQQAVVVEEAAQLLEAEVLGEEVAVLENQTLMVSKVHNLQTHYKVKLNKP